MTQTNKNKELVFGRNLDGLWKVGNILFSIVFLMFPIICNLMRSDWADLPVRANGLDHLGSLFGTKPFDLGESWGL